MGMTDAEAMKQAMDRDRAASKVRSANLNDKIRAQRANANAKGDKR
jgi:hypothetical protein